MNIASAVILCTIVGAVGAIILVAAAKDGCCQFNAVQFQRSFCQIFILPVPWCSI